MRRQDCDKVFREIEKLVLATPSVLCESIARELENYTVTFLRLEHGEIRPAGSATLVSFLDSRYFLTAAHVWERKLKDAEKIIVPLIENTGRRCVITPDELEPYGHPSPTDWRVCGPDIKMLRIPHERVGEFMAVGRSFYNLSQKKERMIDCRYQLAFLMGAPAERGKFTAQSAVPELQGMLVLPVTGPFSTLDSPTESRPDFDYIDLDIDTSQPDVASTFGGVSGGGLWSVYIYKTADGKIETFKILIRVSR
jgi:hypothetical protein